MFDWDEANEGHIWDRHRVLPHEAEEALLSEDRLTYGNRREHGERRFAVIGPTDSGRVLTVIYMWRNGLIRIVSARPAAPRELRHFNAARRGR